MVRSMLVGLTLTLLMASAACAQWRGYVLENPGELTVAENGYDFIAQFARLYSEVPPETNRVLTFLGGMPTTLMAKGYDNFRSVADYGIGGVTVHVYVGRGEVAGVGSPVQAIALANRDVQWLFGQGLASRAMPTRFSLRSRDLVHNFADRLLQDRVSLPVFQEAIARFVEIVSVESLDRLSDDQAWLVEDFSRQVAVMPVRAGRWFSLRRDDTGADLAERAASILRGLSLSGDSRQSELRLLGIE